MNRYRLFILLIILFLFQIGSLGMPDQFRTLVHGKSSIASVRFTTDGKRLVSASTNGTVVMWDVQTEKALWQMDLDKSGGNSDRTISHIQSMALSPDGNLIAVSYDRGKVINSQLVEDDQYLIGLLDTKDGREKSVLSGHAKLIGALAFSPDGKLLASAGGDKMARMWNVETRQQIGAIELPRGASALAFSPSGKLLAVGLGVPMSGQEENAPNFLLSEVQTGKIVRRFSPPGSRYVTDIAFSLDGNLLAIASEVKPDITIWDTKSWANVQTINDHTFNVGEIAFSSKERLFVSSDSLGQVFVRVAGIYAKPKSYKLHVEVKTISLSSDGTKLAAGTAEGKIILMRL